MKIILNESQILTLKEYNIASSILEESLFKAKNFKTIMSAIKKMLYMGIGVATIISIINKQEIDSSDKEVLIQYVKDTQLNKDKESKSDKNSFETLSNEDYEAKLGACSEYMRIALANQNYTFESTGLKPETLVKASIETGFDLAFLMAVAHQESCFGATNRARRTNSVFSVGSYDNGKNAVTYSDPNQSVYGYIKLIENDYLVDGKTLMDLLIPGNFVNYDNNRYASDKDYEKKIKSLRNKILKRYPQLA